MPEPTAAAADPFAGHAIVELMGHLRLAGYTTEVTIAGAGFLRVDVPDADGAVKATKYCSPQSIYAITPCDEATARRTANPPMWRPAAAITAGDDEDYEGEDEDYEGEDDDV